MKQSLISVVVPVYNTEKFLKKCLDSIINQTYKNLEIIVVDDCSPDGSAKILEEYKKKDQRIKVIKHEKNRGLFRARITGISNASGDYIGIVDSDDYISADYYRKLIERADETKADIVMAKVVHENADGSKYVHNAYFNLPEQHWEGRAVLNKFLEQEGLCYIWHTVWNKLYKKSVWNKALPFLKTIEDHIIMCEDVLFSSVLHFYATSFATMDYAYYYYVRHSEASTANDDNFSKFRKNITDLIKTFEITEQFYISNNIGEKNLEHFQNWKTLYSRFWYDNVNGSNLSKSSKKILFNMIKNGLKVRILEPSTRNDHYFYRIMTDWDCKYEKLIERMINDKIKVVSFDVFDTIIKRPFLIPSDLFITLDRYFDTLCKDSILTNFSDIRILAERECRDLLYKSEEVTLDEIYDYIVNKFHITKDVAKKLKQAEIEAEIKYSRPRKSIINLIKLAQHLGKKVICVSDFYMGKDFIKQLLKKQNVEVDDIFVSCEYGLTKRTGTLFKKVLSTLNIAPNKMFHIGDTWLSDYVNPEKQGIPSAFFASCKSSFFNEISDIKSTKTVDMFEKPTGMWINYARSSRFFELRCALALCANKIYDNPYYPFNESTLFNSDANFMGYYALGMHLWSTAKWLYQENKDKSGSIHFIARDGYLPKLAYDILNSKGEARKSQYIYVSRKSLMPLIITNKNSFFGIGNIIKLHKSTPSKLFSLFKPVLNEKIINEFDKDKSNEIFETDQEAYQFIEEVLIKAYDENKNMLYRKQMKKYFDKLFTKGDVSFDIGYSGRTQLLLSNLLGFNIDAYFIHTNSDLNSRKHKEENIKINTLYDYTPAITGTVREVLISELCPSCIGYDLTKEQPVFEDFKQNYSWSYAISNIQEESLNFVKDMFETFGLRNEFVASPMDLSIPYECLMNCAPWQDTDYFFVCEFEDDLWEGKYRLSDLWQRDMNYHKISWQPQQNSSANIYVEPIGEQGVYGKFYNKLNRWFPLGTKRRKFAKKLGKILVGKKQ